MSRGEEFLSRAVGSKPICIVLDIHLGAGLNGFELQERLVSTGGASSIIFITAQEGLPELREREPGTAVNCLRKPFDTDELIAHVRRHLLAEPSETPSLCVIPGGP